MKKSGVFSILLFSTALLWGQAPAPSLDEKTNSSMLFAPKFHAYGLEINLGFRPFSLIPGKDTILWTGLGAAYKLPSYYHDIASGAALNSITTDAGSLSQWFYLWRLGGAQGLTYNHTYKKNSLEFFTFYQGTVLNNSAAKQGVVHYLIDSQNPDKNGLIQNSLMLGISLDELSPTHKHGLTSGYYGELSLDFAPRVIQSVAVDFTRANAVFKGYWPLLDLVPESPSNSFSIFLAEYLSVDYIWGTQPPVFILQSFGGRDLRSGLGSSVRGVEEGRFDSRIKLVNNLDLRINLPSILFDDLIPGLLGYFDVGAYGELAGLGSGYLVSTGYGVFINLFNLGSLAVYQDFWLNGSPYSTSLFRIALGLHF